MKINRVIGNFLLWFALALMPTYWISASEFHSDSFEMKVLGVTFTTQTNEQKLMDAPKWDPFSNNEFPISVKEIFSRAKKQIETEIPSIVSLYPVRIEHRISPVYGAWFSLAVFSYGLESGPTSGIRMPHVVALVYADGSVAPIKKLDKAKGNRKNDNGDNP